MFTTAPKKQSSAVGAERRAYPRFPSTLETSCQPIGSGSSWTAQVRDVSLGGLGLVLSRHFKPGTLLQMMLENEEQNISRSVLARVVHARQQDDGTWLIGCAFSSELDDDDLQAFSATRQKADPSECRAWVRFSCDLDTFCRPADNGRPFKVRVLNIAPGGVGLLTAQPADDGAFFDLDIPGKRGRRNVRIRVIYREQTDEGWFLGCEFSKHLNEDELSTLMG